MRSNKQKSILQEEEAAKLIDGRRVHGSGSVKGKPGDAISPAILVECKFTSKKAITLSKSVLSKIEKDALSSGKIPMLMFGFSDEDRVKSSNSWVAIPVYFMKMLNLK